MANRNSKHEKIDFRLWPPTVSATGQTAQVVGWAAVVILLVLAYRLAVG